MKKHVLTLVTLSTSAVFAHGDLISYQTLDSTTGLAAEETTGGSAVITTSSGGKFCEAATFDGTTGLISSTTLVLDATAATGLVAIPEPVTYALMAGLTAAQAEQPNILFIFADDMSYETIRAHGYLDIDTPNLDRLVEQGTTFSYAYNMGSWTGAVCLASRSMINSGQFVWRTPRNGEDFKPAVAAGETWSQLLKSAGYRTYMTGKWHVPVGATKVFDVAVDIRPGMPKDVIEGYNRPVDEAAYKAGWKPWETKYGGFWQGGTHWSEMIANHAETFLAEAVEDEAPFFMYIAFNAPHDPRQSPKEYIDMYPLERIELPENFIKKYPYQDEIGCGESFRDARLAPFPRTEYSVKVNRQEYFAIITHMDAQIGRILEALDKSGKRDNTYIFFTADHGLAVGHHGLIGKQNMYEHSLRPPFMVVGPGVKAGAQIDTPIYLQDVMPTSLELAGVKLPEQVEFKSLLPLLEDETSEHYEAIYGAYKNQQRAILKDGYKLVIYPTIDVVRLYNLNKDPQEMQDLAQNPEYALKVQALLADFKTLQAELDDPLDLGQAR